MKAKLNGSSVLEAVWPWPGGTRRAGRAAVQRCSTSTVSVWPPVQGDLPPNVLSQGLVCRSGTDLQDPAGRRGQAAPLAGGAAGAALAREQVEQGGRKAVVQRTLDYCRDNQTQPSSHGQSFSLFN